MYNNNIIISYLTMISIYISTFLRIITCTVIHTVGASGESDRHLQARMSPRTEESLLGFPDTRWLAHRTRHSGGQGAALCSAIRRAERECIRSY